MGDGGGAGIFMKRKVCFHTEPKRERKITFDEENASPIPPWLSNDPSVVRPPRGCVDIVW